MIDVYFAKTKECAKIPCKKSENAGYDIYACFDEDFIIIRSHRTVLIPTGIASAIDEGCYFQLFERGSTGTKGIGQRCGVIDSGYRNEWFIPITNHNDEDYIVIAKDFVTNETISQTATFGQNYIRYPYEKAICQAVILPVPKTKVTELSWDELKNMTSERMMGNLGSSNK